MSEKPFVADNRIKCVLAIVEILSLLSFGLKSLFICARGYVQLQLIQSLEQTGT